MFIRPISDVHLEFKDYVIPPLHDDENNTLVLAGDIGVLNHRSFHERYVPFIERASAQFKHVVVIAGNHEHYRGILQETVPAIREAIKHCTNVHFLDNSSVVLDGIGFIGSTLWTSVIDSPYAAYDWKMMADSQTIRDMKSLDGRFTVARAQQEHERSIQAITHMAAKFREEGRKFVLVTHHGVSNQSISEEYEGSSMNCFFVTDLESNSQLGLWNPEFVIHGHVHSAFAYGAKGIPDERLITVYVNPRGYPNERQETCFFPHEVVELKE